MIEVRLYFFARFGPSWPRRRGEALVVRIAVRASELNVEPDSGLETYSTMPWLVSSTLNFRPFPCRVLCLIIIRSDGD